MKKKMWYDCQWDNCPQETKMTQKLTTIGHGTLNKYKRLTFLFFSAYLRSLVLGNKPEIKVCL